MWFYKQIWPCGLLLFVLAVTLSCGFKPLYSESSVKKEIGGRLEISEVHGKEGFHLKEELVRRFGKPDKNAYLLDLKIETLKTNEVISPNNEITSYTLIMSVNYDVKNRLGQIVLPNQRSIVRTGFSSARKSTGYATQIAEEAAKKRLVIKIGEMISTRLSLLSEKWLR
jgi:hypothetical protein